MLSCLIDDHHNPLLLLRVHVSLRIHMCVSVCVSVWGSHLFALQGVKNRSSVPVLASTRTLLSLKTISNNKGEHGRRTLLFLILSFLFSCFGYRFLCFRFPLSPLFCGPLPFYSGVHESLLTPLRPFSLHLSLSLFSFTFRTVYVYVCVCVCSSYRPLFPLCPAFALWTPLLPPPPTLSSFAATLSWG